MWHVLILGTGMAFGLYAGKKRAKGQTWREVIIDLAMDLWRNAKSAWNKASVLFRREVKPEDGSERNEGAGANASDEK